MEKFRLKILACFLAVALVVLTTPIGLNFDTEKKSIEIQSNKAHAVVPVAGAAAAFLADIAAASGLTVSEFIATVAGVSAIGVGLGIATETGINYGNSASDNLDSLIDAADYPPWDSLSASEQESWGSKEYYDTAKFNKLLDAFDLGDARERFYSSSGGNIDYTESELSKIEKIGSIGANWIQGIGNTIGDVKSVFGNNGETTLRNLIGLDYKLVKGSDYNSWPEGAPSQIFVNQGTNATVTKLVNNQTQRDWFIIESDSIVYITAYYDGSNRTNLDFYSKESFSAKLYTGRLGVNEQPPTLTRTYNPTQYTYNGQTYYYLHSYNANVSSPVESTNVQLSGTFDSTQINKLRNCYEQILFGEDLGIGESTPIIGYPESVNDDDEAYFPEDGISPLTEWVTIITPPESGGGDTGDADIQEIIRLLKQFKFDSNYDLLVNDRLVRSVLSELVSIGNKFKFYTGTGQLKVHDEGVFDAVGDLGTYLGGLLTQIQATLSGFFVTDTATDVIGDLDFPDLGDKAVDLVDTISTLAPFGAMLLISELVAILSQVGKIQTPSMVFDFNFMPDHEYDLTVDLSWLADAKPIINVACIITLIVALAGTTARLIELEAAA